ncbi:caspase family protein [Thermocoleostomius sinensis]|uniref:Caspase family protein n=1 Tax=Thermocoleostomius sinensis A174 TaxID=2016057 RepID=A0A9E8ZI32_9CYAN|nr:caspase family protein [Thermocoleostomius sinensis]WAL61620.1 caspase family protein [Thermocoleostomius sinensis A174]
MANYWAITIGIDRYQHLQPLMYAQRDAQAFRTFLIQEAKIPAKHCFLLTDSASRRHRTEIYPTRDGIQACIARMCQQRLQPGDFLWCFFSGYGVRFDGKDYLLPIDCRLEDVTTTGIPIERLFSTFETAPTDNILLVLDVNRNQGQLPAEGVGDQVALLAREHGVPTIVSCLPDQVSHETLALRQGLFTTALLEGLRSSAGATLEQLVQYLSYRLPELSHHHWRPRQDPFAIIPSEKRFQFVLPDAKHLSVNGTIAPFPDLPIVEERLLTSPDFVFFDSGVDVPVGRVGRGASEVGRRYPTVQLNPAWHFSTGSEMEAVVGRQSETRMLNAAIADRLVEEDLADSVFWRRMLAWSGLVAAVLLIGVVVRNTGTESPPSSALDAEPIVESETSSPVQGIAPSVIEAEPGSPLESAYLEARARNFLDAKQFLNAVPAEERNADFDRLLDQINKGLLSDAKIQLARTRELTSENQAADFVEAMKIARLIQPNEPQYQEAQQYITRWSHVILDMAQGRADRRNDSSTSIAADNFGAAITTARMVPPDNAEVYQKAQKAINQWSQQIFDLAQDRADEAKYEVAVQTAEIIPPDVAIYPEVQAAIAVWQDKPSLLILPTP